MKKKTIYYASSGVCLALSAACLFFAFKPAQRTETEVVNSVQQAVVQSVEDSKSPPVTDTASAAETEGTKNTEENTAAAEQTPQPAETETQIPAGSGTASEVTKTSGDSTAGTSEVAQPTETKAQTPAASEDTPVSKESTAGAAQAPQSMETASVAAGNAGAKATGTGKVQISDSKVKETIVENYKSPVDFEELQKMNPDIYAWLYIPGTIVNYPVCQSTDDSYYLDHDEKRLINQAGALYTESEWNTKDFTELLSVIYGHNLNNGTMFGSLQVDFSSKKALEDKSEIIVYLPDRELHYTLVTGTKFDCRHLICSYNNPEQSKMFWFVKDMTSTHEIGSYVNEELELSKEDNYLVLSTCDKGSRDKRFLVVSTLTEIIH